MAESVLESNKYKSADWPFLLFLLSSTYVKLYVKIAAIILYFFYLRYKGCSFPKILQIHKFYFGIIIIGLVSSFLAKSFQLPGYGIVFTYGLVQWLAAGIISYFIYTTIVNIEAERYHSSLRLFFIINIIWSAATLLVITISVGGHFPYWLNSTTYGVSTGDYINGILSDTSLANAAVSVVGAIYFLYRKDTLLSVMCCIVMLLCTSNMALMLFVAILLLLIIFAQDRQVKSAAIMLLVLNVVIYPVLSPLNLKYVTVLYERETGENKKVGKEKLPTMEREPSITPPVASDVFEIYEADGQFRQDDLNNAIRAGVMYPYGAAQQSPFIAPAEFSRNIDKYQVRLNGVRINVAGELGRVRKLAVDSISKKYAVTLDPYVLQDVIKRWYIPPPGPSALTTQAGKVYSFIQTSYFLRSSPKNFFLGAGMGNFSSKVALKMTGLGVQGDAPGGYNYISKDFVQYHFFTVLYYLSQHAGEHSILNTPNSTYNQLAGEYGILGFLLFIILYLGYFWKNRKYMRGGKYILLLMLLFHCVEYWFEILSLTVIAEAIILQEIYYRRKHAAEQTT